MTSGAPSLRTSPALRAATWAAAALTAAVALLLLALVAITPEHLDQARAVWRGAGVVARWSGLALAGALALVLLVHPATPVHLRHWPELWRTRYRLHTDDYVGTLHQVRRTPNAPDLLRLARMHQDAGQHVDALQALFAARALDPTLAAVRYQLARSLLALRRLPMAADELTWLLTTDPGHDGGRARVLLAEALLGLGQAQPALELVRGHEAQATRTAESAWLRARCLQELGASAESLDACREAVALGMAASRPSHEQRLAAARARWRLWRHGLGAP